MAALEGSPCRRVSRDPAVLRRARRWCSGSKWTGFRLPAVRARLAWLVERASDRAVARWVRGSLRAMVRPEVPERLLRLAAGLIAIAAKSRAMRNRRIHGNYRQKRGKALEGRVRRGRGRSVQICALPSVHYRLRFAQHQCGSLAGTSLSYCTACANLAVDTTTESKPKGPLGRFISFRAERKVEEGSF